MWNAWPFRRRWTWTRKHNVYRKDAREISWGRGDGRLGYLNYRDGPRSLAVLFELGAWNQDIKLRPPQGPWTLEDGSTQAVSPEEARVIVGDIAEALGERDYKVGT